MCISVERRIDYTLGIFNLLSNVMTKKHIGSVPIEAVSFSIEKELLKRTDYGNFELTDKGMELLNGKLNLDVSC
ncbi:MAG: hypothetical protein ACXVI9_04120 [Mucilaginibacter sp.]